MAETKKLFRFIKKRWNSKKIEKNPCRDRPIYSCMEKILCIYKSAGLLVLAKDWQNYRPLFYVTPLPQWGIVYMRYGSETCDKKLTTPSRKNLFWGDEACWTMVLTLDGSIISENIEWFIENQAFSRSCELAHRPPLPAQSVYLTGETQEDWERERGRRKGVGEEQIRDCKKA